MKLLRNMPIKRKVLLVTLLVAAGGLLLTGGALFGFQVYSFQNNFPRELAADGSIIASHSVGPLALKDPSGASEMLGALKAKPHISEAQLRLVDGTLFARKGNDATWRPRGDAGLRHEGKYLVYSEQLILDREHIGTLHLRADYRAELVALLKVYALVLGVVVTLSILLTALLSARLQRVISEPILSLARTAKAIAVKKDYSVRAEKYEDDEIGQFTDAFNEMVEEIQHRDSALRRSRQKLEALINTIEGVVWEADPATLKFSFVSAQCERLFGVSAVEWIEGDAYWGQHIDEADRERVSLELKQAVAERRPCPQEYRVRVPGREVIWVRSHANIIVEEDKPVLLRGVLLDVTKEKEAAEAALRQAEMIQTSRHAGMAEVATGVLHNVGNVLNSVNVSTSMVSDRIRKSEVAALAQLSTLLRQHEHSLGEFLTRDPKGKMVPQFIHHLAGQLSTEHTDTLRELDLLSKNIEHIKEIVAMQQSYARVIGVTETLPAIDLVEDALQINAGGFLRHGVEVLRAFEPVPSVKVDRHKVLQILINLLRNAKYAMDEADGPTKQLVLGISRNGNNTVHITVKDNGVGIRKEDLTKIFSHGFTTKRDGHGFGLHTGAIAAKQMGGTISAHSDGPGTGATFTLELPIATETKA